MLKSTMLFLFLLLATSVSDGKEREKYKLLGKAPMGSNFRPIEVESLIPFNKEYDQFNPEQRKLYRSLFVGLKENETPPYPKHGTRRLYMPLIKGNERLARGGWLRLIANINEKGEVAEVSVYESPHDEIKELALVVMFNAKFYPATCDGKPCAMDFQFEYDIRKTVKQMNTLHSEDIPGLTQ